MHYYYYECGEPANNFSFWSDQTAGDVRNWYCTAARNSDVEIKAKHDRKNQI